MKRYVAASALLVGSLLLSGCLGPVAIRQGFQDYSQTLHYNAQQQMLLNLVRLKYREMPFFLKVGALSVNYEMEVGGVLGIADLRDGNTPVGLDVEPRVLEKPTVTYTPVEGDSFVKQILAEIDPNVFFLLLRSGWHAKALCQLLVEDVTTTSGRALSDAELAALFDGLDTAQQNKTLQIVPDGGAGKQPVLHAHGAQWALSQFHFRSFLDVMYALAKNVEVPESQQQWVEPVRRPNGLIQVSSSRFEPSDAYVSVKHHGHYFSISQRDVASKNTFALLQILYQIQAGDIKAVQPVLTLPIGN